MSEEEHAEQRSLEVDGAPILPDSVPVSLPELPPMLRVSSAQQFKAIGDSTRSLILQIIKHEPSTAKQLGERLKIPASTIGHHLQVLEAAGLAQICARRLIHGIVAKYYTRTALLFIFDFPPEVGPAAERELGYFISARDELADTLTEHGTIADISKDVCNIGFPHARLSKERAEEYSKRLYALTYEFATEPPDPNGEVYGFCNALFLSPSYLQSSHVASTTPASSDAVDDDSDNSNSIKADDA